MKIERANVWLDKIRPHAHLLDSENEEEQNENDKLDHNDHPEVAMIRIREQILHFVISVNHICLCFLDVVS